MAHIDAARFEDRAVFRSIVLQQLNGMPAALHVGNLDMTALYTGHLFLVRQAARCALTDQVIAKNLGEEPDRIVQIPDGDTGVIGLQNFNPGHMFLLLD